MPRYHFNLVDGVKILDPEGRTLDNGSDARREAQEMARALKKSNIPKGWKRVQVTDEAGHNIAEVPLRKDGDES